MNADPYKALAPLPTQRCAIKEIIKETETINTYRLCSPDGAPLAPIRAGHYLSAFVDIGGVHTSRPYSICSSPALAENGEYQISVEDFEGSFVAGYIHKNWSEGDIVGLTAPHGDYVYDKRRDTPHIVCIAGGSGVTPYLSLARAVDDGLEDCDITLLFGNGSWGEVPFKDELARLERGGRLRVVHVLANETREGCERGFIDRKIIKEYALDQGRRTVWVCGPGPMYTFVDAELAALGITKDFIRHAPYAPPHDLKSEPDYRGDPSAVYELTASGRGGERKIPARADETLLVAMERAGMRAKCVCRSGECGACRVRLLAGEVYVPERELAATRDDPSDIIRECYTFPLSDVSVQELEK